jgi:hypothetical protein
MNYKITALERKTTSTGKSMIKATLIDESNAEATDVAIWSGFQDFANLAVGSTIVGELEVKQNGQFLNKSLKSPMTVNSGASRTTQINNAMEKKADMITKAQDNKGESIKIAGTMRDAVLCAIAEYNKDPHNLDTLEQLITKWRRTLWFEWENTNDFPPFK